MCFIFYFQMIFFGLLCLTASVFAHPAVYVSRTRLEYPYSYYYPWDGSLVGLPAVTGGEEAKEIIIPGIPSAPELDSIPLSIILKPAEELKVEEPKPEEPKEGTIEPNNEEEAKEDEELKEDEPKEEESKAEEAEVTEEGGPKLKEAPEESDKTVVVRLKPPEFLNNFIQSLPITIPSPNFLFFGPIFGKIPAPTPVVLPVSAPLPGPVTFPAPESSPVETVRYRIAYAPIAEEPLVVAKK